MTQEEISEYNKMCAEFLGIVEGYFKSEIDCPILEYQWMVVSANCTYEMQKEDFPLLNVYDYLKFHSDWNWIMEIVDAIETKSKHTIMSRDLYNSFDIGNRSIKFYFGPDNNYLLQLELQQFLSDEPWTHSMYKHHIIQQFDFKTKGKKQAVVEAINLFLIWYKTQTINS